MVIRSAPVANKVYLCGGPHSLLQYTYLIGSCSDIGKESAEDRSRGPAFAGWACGRPGRAMSSPWVPYEGGLMPRTTGDFAAGVLDAYRRSDAHQIRLAKSLNESAAKIGSRPTGHPDFADLPLGATACCDAAVVFLDLDEFTARTFWDSPESMVRLAQAVLTQVVEVVVDHGGFVLGLRGDGVFACFGGPGSDPSLDVALALGAAAFALDATENALNNLLIMDGLDPVRLRAGADHGRLDFVCTGCDGASEVNIIGFVANFAAKCEKIANSWELVAGEGLTAHIPNKDLVHSHPASPKRYTRGGLTRSYSFHDIEWRSIAPHAVGVRDDLAGTPVTKVRIR